MTPGIPPRWLVLALLLVTGNARVLAEPPATGAGRLAFRLAAADPAIRSDAPFAIDCVLNSTFPQVLEGAFEFVFLDDNAVVLRVQSDPVAISGGQSSFRVTLPPVATRRVAATFFLRVYFHSAKDDFDLGNHDLIVPREGARQFLIGAPDLSRVAVGRLAVHLRLDAFRPEQSTTQRADLVTIPTEIDLRSLPAQAISFYPYDLLLLAEDGFSRLSAKQLDAVADWLAEGGRVVVVPSGVLTPAHQHFLEKITSDEPNPPQFALDHFGHLAGETPAGPAILARRYGFGRVLILRKLPELKSDGTFQGIDEPTWTRAVCFIWNVRNAQTQTILKSKAWNAPPPPQRYTDEAHLRPLEFPKTDALRRQLFPRSVSVMPFGVVAAILALFLLAVGPGDYYLYGFLRRWSIRWIAFPATCLVFTLGTVWIAGNYTGRVDHRTELAIVDLGPDGKARRISRIEHVLTAQTRPLAIEVHNGILARTQVQPTSAATSHASGVRGWDVNESELDPFEDRNPPTYSGTFPTKYSVVRIARQWTPRMHRITRPATDVKVPAIAWSDLDALDLTSNAGRQALVDALRRAIPDCEVELQNGWRQFVTRSGEPPEDRENSLSDAESVLAALARQADAGLFSIVSHLAPSGAGNLEDLAVVDPDQADEWLVQVIVHQGDDLLVYRRLMRRKSNIQLEQGR
jgi:hypothetical protein